MKPILFPASETQFTSNGLGRLDPISCTVTEERNGQYELEMVISIDDPHYQDIEEGRMLLVRHDDTTDKQPFEIYSISRPIDGKVTVYAHHISYRTAKITVLPYTAAGISLALNGLHTYAVDSCPFTFTTTKTNDTTYRVEKPSTIRALLAGQEGSILDVYGGGEYEWDRFTVRLHPQRGTDTGVVLRYGKDITDLRKVTDMSNVWTGIVPFWYGIDETSNQEVLVKLPENVLYCSSPSSYAYAMIVPLDMTSYFETKPTEVQLRAAAQTYIANNEVTAIPVSIDVSFVNLADTEEYREVAVLQRLKLCDTLTVVYSKLGVQNEAKIVKTVYDVLQERYISMTIGDVRSNLATTISQGLQASIEDLQKTAATRQGVAAAVSGLEAEFQDGIDEATRKITGGDGGYVVMNADANGHPREILIMNTADTATATQVLRMNMNGIGFSSTGINGPYTSAWTLDGRFVADFIQSGTLNANLLRAGSITDASGNNTWNLTTGAMDFQTLSWTSSHSSMTSDGRLTCEGATINGSFAAEYTPDATVPELQEYSFKVALEDTGFNFYVNDVLSATIHEDADVGLDEHGTVLIDNGLVIRDPRGNGLTMRSTNSSLTLRGNVAELGAGAMVEIGASSVEINSNGAYGHLSLTSQKTLTLESTDTDIDITAGRTINLTVSRSLTMNGNTGYTGTPSSSAQLTFLNGILIDVH